MKSQNEHKGLLWTPIKSFILFNDYKTDLLIHGILKMSHLTVFAGLIDGLFFLTGSSEVIFPLKALWII